jgi:transposase
MSGMRKDHSGWNNNQINTMYLLQRSNLKSARAWRLKEALRTTRRSWHRQGAARIRRWRNSGK